MNTEFLIALLQIVGVNIVLSGDNAVVIALAARALPERQQKTAVVWGSAAAVAMRIALTAVAVELLKLPYLKVAGACVLLWIGVQLLIPDETHEGDTAKAVGMTMAAAIRTILVADLVMSLDNVMAVAAAAKGSMFLLVAGLLISIPLVVFGSTFLMRLMDRWPAIVTLGGALIGWVAGELIVAEWSTDSLSRAQASLAHLLVPALAALSVLVAGKALSALRHRSATG